MILLSSDLSSDTTFDSFLREPDNNEVLINKVKQVKQLIIRMNEEKQIIADTLVKYVDLSRVSQEDYINVMLALTNQERTPETEEKYAKEQKKYRRSSCTPF